MKKKKNKNTIFIITGIILIIVMAIGLLYFTSREQQIKRELLKQGYSTEKEEAFYNKVVTNNTLEEYYNDVSSHKDSNYEEYYVSKESNSFIELKLSYQNKINTTLNISTELKTNKTNYHYEVSYQNSYLLLEGNSDTNYNCDVVDKKNINQKTVDYYCELVIVELNNFLQKKNELLQNNKVYKNLK